jgi:transitional endoplasmic reticulum ATPase
MARRSDGDGAVAEERAVTTTVTEAQRTEEMLLDTLAEIGGRRVSTDALKRQGREFVIPETMSLDEAEAFLSDYRTSQETETAFSRQFRYKPWDVAHALQSSMKRVFGTAGIQKAQWSFFGKRPPEQRTISIGHGQTTQVPWGEITVPIFQGTMHLGANQDPEYGLLGQILIYAPKRFQAEVEGLFTMVEQELRTNSIYRGKAVDGQEHPEFIDLSTVDPKKVIYAEEVKQQLEANIWSLLRHTDTMRELQVPLKRAVLLEGKYGTGKTLAAFMTAQIAVENGWSFVYCRPGKDDLGKVMATARLYQPAVVFFEDVDTIGGDGNPDSVTMLLDIFDGINAKGTELLAVMTTNHPEKIHKGMVRPGRLDAVIHIGGLDHAGVQQMVEATVPESLLADGIDWHAVGVAMEGYLPAFVKEAIDRTMRYAIAREGGRPSEVTTTDFVGAADGLRDQLKLMEDAGEGVVPEPLEVAMANLIRAHVPTAVLDRDGDKMYELAPSNGESFYQGS